VISYILKKKEEMMTFFHHHPDTFIDKKNWWKFACYEYLSNENWNKSEQYFIFHGAIPAEPSISQEN
jgi:hypothetical protein